MKKERNLNDGIMTQLCGETLHKITTYDFSEQYYHTPVPPFIYIAQILGI